MELVKREFSAECPKETKDILDLVESLTIGLLTDAKDGLEISEIITRLTLNIGKVSSAVEGATQVGSELEAHKAVMADYVVKWGAELGKQVMAVLETNKAEVATEA